MSAFKFDYDSPDHGKLPVFDHIPEWIYEQTKVPQSYQEGIKYLQWLSTQCGDVKAQLTNFRNNENAHWQSGDLQALSQWRYRTTQKYRVLRQQAFLIQAWLSENKHLKTAEQDNLRRQQSEKTAKFLTHFKELGFTEKQLKSAVRETKFLRHKIGEIAAMVTKVLEKRRITPEDLQALKMIRDQLLEADNEVNSLILSGAENVLQTNVQDTHKSN